MPNIRKTLETDLQNIPAYIVKGGNMLPIMLYINALTEEEKKIIKDGCLINFNRQKKNS